MIEKVSDYDVHNFGVGEAVKKINEIVDAVNKWDRHRHLFDGERTGSVTYLKEQKERRDEDESRDKTETER